MNDLNSIYWLIDCLHAIDVGVVAIDRDYKLQLWNRFMENNSGIKQDKVLGQNLFEAFPDLPEEWVRRKADSVFSMKNRTYSTWEQREYLFQFGNHRPITGWSKYMYQNIAFVPFTSADMEVRQVGIIVYDVTDIAVGRIELERANIQLRHLSRTDKLTGLNNRGYWEECLVKEFNRARRYQNPVSLIMFDIDHFKKVNDTYGHQAGDEVIRQTSSLLMELIRTTDIGGRYGGEEFGVILTDTDAKGAHVLAERLREKIAASSVTYENDDINYTISLGIAQFDAAISSHTDWLERSDKALYTSKENGRNQTNIFDG